MSQDLHAEEPQEQANMPQLPTIILPAQTLIVLCGPAASGKSTFARTFIARHQAEGINSTAIISSDTCRALVCDDESMQSFAPAQQQQIQRDTFELFYSLLAKRLNLGRLTILDTLALHETERRAILTIAQRFHVHTCLVVFHLSLQTCLAQNQDQQRAHRIPDPMITDQFQRLQPALLSIPHEGWDQVCILDELHRDIEVEIVSTQK